MKPNQKFQNKTLAQSFLDQAKQIKVARPAPKFKIGDYVVNTKYKIISKIVDIKGIFDNEDRTVNYDCALYVMQDLKNTVREDGQARELRTQNWLVDESGQREEIIYKRTRPVHGIDFGYSLMNPDAARALYSKRETKE